MLSVCYAFAADPELLNALMQTSTCAVTRCCRTLFTQGESPKGVFIITMGSAKLLMRAANRPLMQVRVEGGLFWACRQYSEIVPIL